VRKAILYSILLLVPALVLAPLLYPALSWTQVVVSDFQARALVLNPPSDAIAGESVILIVSVRMPAADTSSMIIIDSELASLSGIATRQIDYYPLAECGTGAACKRCACCWVSEGARTFFIPFVAGTKVGKVTVSRATSVASLAVIPVVSTY